MFSGWSFIFIVNTISCNSIVADTVAVVLVTAVYNGTSAVFIKAIVIIAIVVLMIMVFCH